MSTRTTGTGLLIALLSAATFATSGPFAKSLLETGWTPGSVVFLRIAGAALLLLVPALRGLRGRWTLLRREWRQVVAYGLFAIAVPQLAFFYAVEHLSVGVALLLEYLGLVLVVAWQAVAARMLPRAPTVLGVVLALVGLVLVLDLFGGVRVDGVGVVWGLIAALGLASYFLLSSSSHETALPPLVLAGGGLTVGAIVFAVLGLVGALPMRFPMTSVQLAGASLPWWAAVLELGAIAAATAYVTGIVAARVLGAKLASFVGLSEVLFAVLFAWVLLGELPRPVQLVGGVFILAGVITVRTEEGRTGGPKDQDRRRAQPMVEPVPAPPVELPPEPLLALGLPPLGGRAVVTHDRVELGGVDVAAAQDQGGAVVLATKDHRPV